MTISKIALYTRVSTGKQDTKLQREKLIKYCESRGYGVHKIYDEKKSGASTSNRPQFKQLMEDAQKGLFDAVLVTKLDRFGRSLKDLVTSMETLKKSDVAFISTNDNIDTSTNTGRFMFHILCSVAEFERSIIIERIVEGRERADRYGSKSGLPCHRPRMDIDMEKAEEYLGMGLSVSGVSKLVGCAPSTLSRRLRERGVKSKRTWVEE